MEDHDSKDTETRAPGETRSDPGSAEEPAVDLWAVSYSEEDDRELTGAELARALQRGEIDGTTLVWRPGMADWRALSQTPDFAALLAQIPSTEDAGAAPESIPAAPTDTDDRRPAGARSAPAQKPARGSEAGRPLAVALSDTDLEELAHDFRPHRARYVMAGATLVAAAIAGVVWWSLAGSSSEAADPLASGRPATENTTPNPPSSSTPVTHEMPASAPAGSVSAAPNANLRPFDRLDALKIAGVAAHKAIRCRGRGTPAGIARVTVTFQPSGVMSSARILQAPYAGTPTATCILAKMGKPSVAPFKGHAVTMRVPVELH